ncbi:hypothetical protein GLYMA_13G078601v4 [Glycine max]|nr:hypothetical protein GLYMA_13G078601v4 [Glycine max]KAH1100331.1 hypothetical protein GYH30_035479 [Glycine max]
MPLESLLMPREKLILSIICPFIEKLLLLLSKKLHNRFLLLESRLLTCLHHIKEEERLGCLVVLV